jgi:hypothetical protein
VRLKAPEQAFLTLGILYPTFDRPPKSVDIEPLFTMAIGFFQNYRVYLLTTVAYMGSLLFGKPILLL